MSNRIAHPLDIDLAGLVDNLVDGAHREVLNRHLEDCLLCRIKVRRLLEAIDDPGNELHPIEIANSSIHSVGIGTAVPQIPDVNVTISQMKPGQLWSVGDQERLMVLTVREENGRVFVAPATFDVFSADEETILVGSAISPFAMPIAVYPMLAAELPTTFLVSSFGKITEPEDVESLLAGTLDGTSRGAPIDGPSDPRLEFRQLLADHLGMLEETLPDFDTAADAPPPRPESIASELSANLRSKRGIHCKVQKLRGWEELLSASARGWTPIARVDEFGVVLIVFDTPSWLASVEDFDVARSVLTQFNASAIAVIATRLGPTAKVFNSFSLNYGIVVPSGETKSPAPLLGDLELSDAIFKFLDQTYSWAEMDSTERGSFQTTDVAAVLRNSLRVAISEVVSQGHRAKIEPKIAGFTSIELYAEDIQVVLRSALTGELVADRLSELAERSGS